MVQFEIGVADGSATLLNVKSGLTEARRGDGLQWDKFYEQCWDG